MSIIQQLEDLKEWSKDSTRYERRLAFRGSMGTQAGTIPPEWDELSDREREYYRTGPWSTREDYSKGQLVQPGPGRQGYGGKDYRELEPEFVERIREKIKLKPGQKWRFDLHTFGVPKGDPLYNKARYYGYKREQDIAKQAEYAKHPEKVERRKATQKKRYDIHKEEILEQGKEYRAQKDVAKKRIIQQAEYLASPHGSAVRKAAMTKQMAEVGVFPSGNNYNENVWRDLWRSSQKKGQERFIWVDENGNRLSKKDLPKKDGKVYWTSDYKKIKFYDTKTKQFIKLDDSIKGKGISMEKYLNQKSVGGSGAYEGAINTYKNKDAYKSHKIMYKGKEQNLGTILRDKLFSPMDKKKAQFGKSAFVAAHPDIDNQWWKSEVAFADANQQLEYLERTLARDMKVAKDTAAKNKVLANFAKKVEKQPGGITRIIEGTTYGIKPTERSVITAAGQEANLMKSKNFRNWIKKFPCKRDTGGSVDINCHIEGMRHEKNLVKSGQGSRAMANKFIEGTTLARKGKFGKVTRGFLRGTVVGDILFEGAYAGYNWLQGEDAADIWKLSWYSFADPNLWKDGKYIGWMEDAEQAKLYTRTDNREFIYTDGKESKNPNFGKAIGIIPEIKRYVDNANKLQKQFDLQDNVFQAELPQRQDPASPEGAQKRIMKAKTELSDFNTRMNLEGGEGQIYKDLEQDQKAFLEREEVVGARKLQKKMDRFEWLKSKGAFPEEKEFLSNEVKAEKLAQRRQEEMEAVNQYSSIFSSPEALADYFVSEEDAQSYIKANYPTYYGHVASKRLVPFVKQHMFSRFREDPRYNQFIISQAAEYDPSWKGTQYQQGGRVSYFDGGIASIRRPWAIPPESGPMPQGGGLSSQFNRVKKLTG